MKFYFPIHLDSGNRGCEGIAKGTAKLLNLPKEQLIGLCSNVELDKRLYVENYITLINKHKLSTIQRIVRKILSIFHVKSAKRFGYRTVYKPFLDDMRKDDIMLSTGGDMMCYDDNEVIYTNNFVNSKGYKSILWGCSFDEKNITREKLNTLKKFSYIYSRESLSEEVFRRLGFTNVCCYPDPAFILEPEHCELPQCFQKNKVIGFNVSNYVLGDNQEFDSEFGKDVIKLIETILNKSDHHILLIPHVLWKNQDDRIASKRIYEKFLSTNRISMLDSDSLNYLQIRYVISNLYIFIGARTHAMISAYSTFVPAIALGYSIKSRGIAHDIGLSELTVVDTTNYKTGTLLDSYNYLILNYQDVKRHLDNEMPIYISKTYEVQRILQNI